MVNKKTIDSAKVNYFLKSQNSLLPLQTINFEILIKVNK